MAAIATTFALKYGKGLIEKVKDVLFKPPVASHETSAQVIPMANFVSKTRANLGTRAQALSTEEPIREVLDRDFEADGFKLAAHGGTTDDVAIHVRLIRTMMLTAVEVVAEEARRNMAMIDRELIAQGKLAPVQAEGLRFDRRCFEEKVARVDAEKVLVAQGQGLAEIPELKLSLGYNSGIRERTAHSRPKWTEG